MSILRSYLGKLADSGWNLLRRDRNMRDTAVASQDETLTSDLKSSDVELSPADAYLNRLPVVDVREVRHGGVRVDVDRREVFSNSHLNVSDSFLNRDTRDSLKVDTDNSDVELRVFRLEDHVVKSDAHVGPGYASRFDGELTLREYAEMSLIGRGDDLTRAINRYTTRYILGDELGRSATVDETRAAMDHVDRVLSGFDSSSVLNENARKSGETLRAILSEKINYLSGDSDLDFRSYLTESLVDRRLNDMKKVQRRVKRMGSIVEGKNYNFESKEPDDSEELFDKLTVTCLNVDGRVGYNVNFNNSNGMYLGGDNNRVYWSVLDDFLSSDGKGVDSRILVSRSIRRGLRSSGYYNRSAVA